MKSFFYTVFGGLAALGIGVVIAHGVRTTWPVISSTLHSIHMPSVHLPSFSVVYSSASRVMGMVDHSASVGNVSMSGIAKTVRYTASEEEDLISAASLSLPSLADNKITASAYMVRNINLGDTPAEHNSDRIMPIASLTKLVTAIVARREIAADARISITRNIMATYGNTAQFKIGETFIADDLYYPLLMVSSNDAAEAFAQYYGRAKFIQAMNDFTQSIGAYRTSFSDPSGLSPLDVSSAGDLVLVLRWIEDNDPGILDITKLKSKTVRSHTWVNPTHFLNWSNYVGGKNGYTPEADRTGAALFSMDHDKDIYAVIILGSESRDADVIKLLSKIK